MALPPDFAKSTADSIFHRTILSAEAIFMKPLFMYPSSRVAFYDRESFLKCGAALVGRFVLTRNYDFAQAALGRLQDVLAHDRNANAQVFLYRSLQSTLDGFLCDDSGDFCRIFRFVESRCDIYCAIKLKNGSAVEELCRRGEDIILRAQKAVLKDRNPTESIRSICNYLRSAASDEQLDETAMVDFEDLVQCLRKVVVLDRENRLKCGGRKISFCHYESDEEEDHPLQGLVSSMVAMQGIATPKDGMQMSVDKPAKDGGGSCASSTDEEENNVEKTIEELVDFTQFVIFEHFRISAEDIYANDDRNPDNLTMLGAAWLGRSLLEKSSEDAIYCLQFAVVKLQYALDIAPDKPDASFYLAKALEAINLLKCDTTESVSCANDSVMGKENKKVAVNRKRKLGEMQCQNSGGDT